MKYYKIKLPHTEKGYVYPPNYISTMAAFNQGHVYYDDPVDVMFTLLMAIPDKNALSVLPENVIEVTETEANIIGNQFDPSVEKITNEAIVQRLQIKATLGQVLTTKELAALDPDNLEPGFGKTESFVARIEKKKVILGEV